MPTTTRWRKLRSDHCSPDRPDALAAWEQHGEAIAGMTAAEVLDHLSPWGTRETCPVPVARFVQFVVSQLGLSSPPEDWPNGYAEPGHACPIANPRPVSPAARVVIPSRTPNRAQVARDIEAHGTGQTVTTKAGPMGTMEVNARGQGLVKNVDDLARVSEMDLDEWRVADHSVNTWTTAIKGDDGVPQIVRNWQVKARLERRMIEASAWGVVRAGPPMPRVMPATERADRVALLVPDSQHGFRWSADRRKLLPMHDPIACDAVTQVAAAMQPDEIVLLGDMLDLAEWSTKFPRPMDLRDTSQASLYALHHWIAELRAACPSARIIYLEGNHEDRIGRLLIEKAAHVAGLTAIGDDRAALSLPRLLALDEIGVEYVEPYGEFYSLSDRVEFTHGSVVRSGGGATVRAVVGSAHTSVAFGHVHRVSIASRTIYGPGGERVITAATPGCLCDTSRTPANGKRLDWQQGWGVVHYGDGYDHWQVSKIERGRTFYNGRMIVGEDRHEEIGTALGLPIAS